MSLFRTEVVKAQRHQDLGTIIIHHSTLSWMLFGVILIFITGLLSLLIVGEYTRRVTVSGYLIPTTGIVRITSPITGRLKRIHVQEGQAVLEGDRLMVVVDERITNDGTDTRDAYARQADVRKASLHAEFDQLRTLFKQTRLGLDDRVNALLQELEQLRTEQAMQQVKLAYVERTNDRYRELATQGFISPMAEQERSEAVVEQRSRLQALERNQTALRRELIGLQSERAALPMRERSQAGELQRRLADAEQAVLEFRSRSEVIVKAPRAGRISAVTVHPGQGVIMDRPLLTLVPDASQLEAHLFAPSKDIGFLRGGQQVALRYSAFPYQKFGHYKGVVVDVSRTPLHPTELVYPLAQSAGSHLITSAGISATGSEPLFRVKVRLEAQTAMAYGVNHSLQPGMQLESDVLLDRRSLLEWIFEPLFSVRGKFLQ